MICSLCHEELGSATRKAVPEPPGVVKRKILILVPVDDQDRDIQISCQPGRAHTIHFESVKDIHIQHYHGPKKDPEKSVVGAIQASQGLLGSSIAPLEEQEPYTIRI